jgi:hypothetical protein
MHMVMIYYEKFEESKGVTRNRKSNRRTDNAMAKRKKDKRTRQTMMYKTLHRILKI